MSRKKSLPAVGESRGISELYTQSTSQTDEDWEQIIREQHCSYIGKRCAKRRKTEPNVSIGTCTVRYGARAPKDVVICPFRFLERKQVFTDCLHLLTHSTPGDEYHVVAEVAIPGGSVDYCLVAVRRGKVVDFVGIELQAVDTTGSVWPTRQRFLSNLGMAEPPSQDNGYGMNWKMSGKTILVQLHHKVETFEHVGRHFVLVVQNHFLSEMLKSFSFEHIGEAKIGDAMHFHSYSLLQQAAEYRLELVKRISTDSSGVQKSLGNASEAKVELDVIFNALQDKIEKALYTTLLSPTDAGVQIPLPTTKLGLLEE